MSQSTQLSTFNFEQSSIRVIAVNNEPWFVAKDVCDTLGIKNPTQALENLDEDERAMFNIGLEQRVNFDNRVSEINIVSESGMYTLILRCRDAVKKGSVPHRFRKWVTAEVLPQIRKTGQYSQNSTQIAPLTITPEQQRAIQEAVQQAHYRTGLHWKEIYSRLKSTFNVAKYDQLPQ
ncbi:BRO family protein, partial [Glaesserella parasuis]|nr:BRO family protein [Glaesserella parasuis]MDE3968962.1 BRO family protein [Glaesserella parasuis]MDE3971171.1 BRO family protein [Glaesserella parasuis]MDE3983474.1 BRO family protein [Glaesserella parasuis]MDE3992159.1 BRO family protein [Glaesserella parasuis]